MTMASSSIDTEAVARGTALFRGLADPTRLAILLQLRHGERRVVDLAASVRLAQPTVSGHLARLRDCGLVTWRPVGRQSYYRLAVPELDQLLRAAETILARTGDAVALCPTYGSGRGSTA
jgi:ArsR family transcriptional regulator, cadmium/lead-responsive transcriptional repressor